MHLRFVRPHLSISTFPAMELPDFTLITGANGAGKTHLLQALENGCVGVEGIDNLNGAIRLFDWNTIVPQEMQRTAINAIETMHWGYRSAIKDASTTAMRAYALLQDVYAKYPALGARFENDPVRGICTASTEDLIDCLGEADAVEDVRRRVDAQIPEIERRVQEVLSPNMRPALEVIARRAGKPLFLLNDTELQRGVLGALPGQRAFQQSFSQLFAGYRDAALENELAENAARKGQKQSFLSAAEFIDAYGPPPWDLVNRLLETAGLPFKINIPNPLRYGEYQPLLMRCDTGETCNFSSLSSGEKVLLSFVFCMYFVEDRRQLTTFPKVLLLDEVDATLHPSMSKALIDIIIKTLIAECNVKVIATTHSPSTVALAPEESIHVMRKAHPGLAKCSKAEALNLLTEGVPRLALSYEGRRQVFVESDVDAEVYSTLYDALHDNQEIDRSLTFIAVGSDVNGGCDRVIATVDALSGAGNKSVFGLLDWDGTRRDSDRILVMAPACRHSIENIILDPVLVAAAICREFPDRYEEIGLPSKTMWRRFVELTDSQLSAVAAAVTSRILGPPKELASSSYIGGRSANYDKAAMTMRGHDWAEAVFKAYPYLRRIGQSSQDLKDDVVLKRITKLVLADCPELIPIEVKIAFDRLLHLPPH
ncbi:ATP-binding protein [Ensifer sp. YR511]|uniref:AAA family ATPase n=1 Tax=Ensifer sp. YR511 TaxID=1855294 RepID=UPI00088803A7|nr:ATP-binding protein [Ensifer sp. YR511]SDN84351.1 AAA domain-containing protein, putative AbiEii toxin, Type IV TA system [Ensifer sp. YR511]